ACGDDDAGTGQSLPPRRGLRREATSASQVHLSWNAVTGAASYAIQRAEGASGTFAAAGTATTTTFDDQGLNPGTQYRYKVAAVSGSTTSDYSAEASVTLGLGAVD